MGPQLTIDHKGQSLTLTRTFAGNPATITYVLDGTETSSRMPGRLCEPDSGGLWTAAWEGDAVAITMVGAIPPNGQRVKMDVKNVLRLESPDVMRVEQIVRLPNQAKPRTTSAGYKRTAAPTAPQGRRLRRRRKLAGRMDFRCLDWHSRHEHRRRTMDPWRRRRHDGHFPHHEKRQLSGFEFLCIVERDGGPSIRRCRTGAARRRISGSRRSIRTTRSSRTRRTIFPR
jgi:hypothetical protein